MSITSALLGFGIALTTVGALGTILALVNVFVEIDLGTEKSRKRAIVFLTVMVALLAVGGFLLGLTIPAVQQ